MPSGVSHGAAAAVPAATEPSANSTWVKSGILTIGVITRWVRCILSCAAAKVEMSVGNAVDVLVGAHVRAHFLCSMRRSISSVRSFYLAQGQMLTIGIVADEWPQSKIKTAAPA